MLEFRNVTQKYLRRTALDDVSFTLDDGRVALLLGPNGSGKTTSMKLIAGLSRQTSGEVLFNGSASARGPRPSSPTCPPRTTSIII